MNRFEFYYDWYKREEDKKVNLENSYNLPIIALSAILAYSSFMLDGFDFSNIYCRLNVFFIILLSITAFFGLLVVFFLFRSYTNFFRTPDYDFFPYPKKLEKWYEDSKKYYKKEKKVKKNKVEVLFEEDMVEQITGYLEKNIVNNEKKAHNLYLAKQLLLCSFLSSIISSIPFLIQYIN